ncbi:TetR family transcriptional regulator [Streptomyces sp. SID3343]|nr:TetR family transcriptional regulator [Streptomyces sp. SID3343]
MLAATFEALGERGYAELTMDRIAGRSGVHAATIYRRWGTVESIVADLFLDRSTRIPVPDTGSLAGDLRALARGIAAFYADRGHRALIEGAVVAAARRPDLAAVLGEFFEERRRETARIVHRAVERGESAADTDADEVMGALGAPFYYRLLIARRPIDAAFADSVAAATHAATLAGAYVLAAPAASDASTDDEPEPS